MSKLAKGDKVLIEAEVTLVSEDDSHVTIRLPPYGYPVTLPINSVEPRAKTR
ncbi:hypothetical protein [Paradevosia shaoguanensis]|uniref:Uncharacterized protein n=1 Tax=Paradevosia shaoguanensis TaxID=1335043 RepID=A0AA41QIH0_9HYPH|nr:hypothetical protein [Paradevosia shaoguanensis]MCF1740726.1 hypothetical protein [Paradevosia shaoguanensis]MCI0125210.1 hypothetical protein [Paradevosia shaoguanensis]